MRLAGKVAVVTGGARGIGEAIARGFASEGARVCIADIDGEAARTTAAMIGHDAFAVRLDVTSLASIDSMLSEAGPIDILVNNAAIFEMAPIEEITEKSYDRIFAVNVKGLLFTLQAVARQMIAAKRRGKIINMASQAGRRGEPLVAPSTAAPRRRSSVSRSRRGFHSSSTA